VVKPAPFAYRHPATLDETANLLAEFAPQGGRALAGLPGGVTQLLATPQRVKALLRANRRSQAVT
jgi:hypothetical protein